MKTKGLKQFHNEGFVFVINKEVLHPLGMEIQMTQTKRRFSYFDTGKKLIETSLDLNDIYRKFEEIEKSLSKKPKFIQTKMKKQFEQAILDLTKNKNAYYISIEGSELSHANEKQWHKDWFLEWDMVQKK